MMSANTLLIAVLIALIVVSNSHTQSTFSLNDSWIQSTPLTMSISFHGQGYVPYNQYIYFVWDHTFHRFNMESLNDEIISSHKTISYGHYHCLAISNDGKYLFIVGGTPDAALNSFQIYDISNDLLITGPNITTPRELHACATNNYNLYVMGGRANGMFWDSIERINVTNIS
eukprot:503339_1